jgi:uncharacterized protein
MPSLSERLNADLKDAMRAGETVRRDEIRGVLAMLKAEQQAKLARVLAAQGLLEPQNAQAGQEPEFTAEELARIDELRRTTTLSDEEQEGVLMLRVKQHRQSIDSFVKGKRDDLASAEQAQLAIDEAYMPEQMDDATIDAAIQAAVRDTGAQTRKDMGKVMGALTRQLAGKADMKAVAARVQALLA